MVGLDSLAEGWRDTGLTDTAGLGLALVNGLVDCWTDEGLEVGIVLVLFMDVAADLGAADLELGPLWVSFKAALDLDVPEVSLDVIGVDVCESIWPLVVVVDKGVAETGVTVMVDVVSVMTDTEDGGVAFGC